MLLADTDDATLEALASEWWQVHAGAPVRAGDLAKLPASGRLASHDWKPRAGAIALGKVVAAAAGQVIGAWRVDRSEGGDPKVPAAWYELALVGPEPEAPPRATTAAMPEAPDTAPAALVPDAARVAVEVLAPAPPPTGTPRQRARRSAREAAASLAELIRTQSAALLARGAADLGACRCTLSLARSLLDAAKGAGLVFARQQGEGRKRFPTRVIHQAIPLPAAPGQEAPAPADPPDVARPVEVEAPPTPVGAEPAASPPGAAVLPPVGAAAPAPEPLSDQERLKAALPVALRKQRAAQHAP